MGAASAAGLATGGVAAAGGGVALAFGAAFFAPGAALPFAATALSFSRALEAAAVLPLAAGFAGGFALFAAVVLAALERVALDAAFEEAAALDLADFWGLRVGAMSSPAVEWGPMKANREL
nr:MAG: hypothetical protein DIU62_13860 [Pseudomonadota bacterium]